MLSDRCLSCLCCESVCLSVTLVYCGHTVGWIKTKLGMEVGLGPAGHIILDGDPALPQKWHSSPYFTAYVYCGKTVSHLGNWWALVLAYHKSNRCLCGGKPASNKRFVLQHLPEPNRACLVGVYAVTLDPLLSLYGIIYMTWYTRLLPKPTRVRFR